jgi:hypothetical protein
MSDTRVITLFAILTRNEGHVQSKKGKSGPGVRVMVFNDTFNNISVISRWSVLLMEETTDQPQVADEHLT